MNGGTARVDAGADRHGVTVSRQTYPEYEVAGSARVRGEATVAAGGKGVDQAGSQPLPVH